MLNSIKISVYFIGLFVSLAFVVEPHFNLENNNPLKGKVYVYVNNNCLDCYLPNKNLQFINDSLVIYKKTLPLSIINTNPNIYFDSLRYHITGDSIHFESLITRDLANDFKIKLTDQNSPYYYWYSYLEDKPKNKKDSMSIHFKVDDYLSTVYKEYKIQIYHRSKLLNVKTLKCSDTGKQITLEISDYFFKTYEDSSELVIKLSAKNASHTQTVSAHRKIEYGAKYLEYWINFVHPIHKFKTEYLYIKEDKLFFSSDPSSQIWQDHYKQIK